MNQRVEIRLEIPADIDAIRLINDLAFGSPLEGQLVDQLRADDDVLASIVAIAGGAVVGHVLFSRLGIVRADGEFTAAALAPVAVHPDWQRQGIGSAVIRAGIERCRELGCAGVVVLGHRDYYPRFGFSPSLAERLVAPYSGPAFMALEFEPGGLGAGEVRYANAFSIFEE